MEKIRLFFKEYKDELLYKVSWPSWDDLQESTVIVLVSTLIIALVVYLIDLIFGKGLQEFYTIF